MSDSRVQKRAKMSVPDVVLCIGVFLSPFDTLRPFPSLYLTYADIALLLASVLVCRRPTQNFLLDGLRRLMAASFFLMAAGYLISALFAPVDVGLGTASTIVQLFYVLMFLPWLLTRYSEQRVKYLIRVFVFGLGISIAVGLIASEVPALQTALGDAVPEARRFGGFIGPNGLAKLIAICIPAVIGLYLSRVIRLPIFVALSGLCVWATIATASNGGTIAFGGAIVASMVVALATRRLFKALGACIGAAIVTAGILTALRYDPSVFVSRVSETLLAGNFEEAGSFELKARLMRQAWVQIAENPIIGQGANSFTLTNGVSVHNSYLLMWYEGGFLAIFGLGVFLSSLVLTLYRSGRWDGAALGRGFAICIVAVHAVNLVTGTDIYQRFTVLFLVLVVIAAKSLVHERESRSYIASGGLLLSRAEA